MPIGLQTMGPTWFRCLLLLSSPPVAVFLARERLAGKEHVHSGSVEFNVVSLSDSMGWEVVLVKRALRQLQWDPRLRTGTGINQGSSGRGSSQVAWAC